MKSIFDFYPTSRKYTNKKWKTLDPSHKWGALPEVSDVLGWCKGWIGALEESIIIPDKETIDCLRRLEGYTWRVIEMLESNEKYHVTGTSPQPRFELTKVWVLNLRDIVRMDLEGKISPEARPFLALRLTTVANRLHKFIDQLEAI